MREDYFNVFSFKVYRRVKRGFAHPVVYQVEQSVFRFVRGAVEDNGQAFLQERIVLDHGLDEVHVVCVVSEFLAVRFEFHEGSVLLAHVFLHSGIHEVTALELRPRTFAVPERFDVKV